MKKTGLFLLLLLLSSEIFAQITLNQSDFAGPGDVLVNSNQQYSGSLPPTGANQLYSFPESDTTFQDTTVFVSVASTPFASAFPTATMAVNDQGIYYYFKLDNTGYYIQGLTYTLPPIGLNLPFTSAVFPLNQLVKLIDFPATMGMNLKTQATSNFEFLYDTTISIGGLNANVTKARIVATVTDTSIINGYGNAEFAGGTIACLRNAQTLRIKFKVQVFAQILIFPAAWIDIPAAVLDPSLIREFYTKQLLFWANGKKGPVATLELDSNNNVVSADYLTSLLITSNNSIVRTKQIFSFEASPNPAQDLVSFTSEAELKKIKIFSTSGNKISEKNFLPGQTSITLESIASGIYVAELENNKGEISRKKLIINR